MPDSLDYAPPPNIRVCHITPQPDGGVIVNISSIRKRISSGLAYAFTVTGYLDILGLLLFPLLVPFFWSIYIVMARDTPRAVIRLTPDTLFFTATLDNSLGFTLDRRQWARRDILEIRRNRYDGGLYIRLRNHDALTLLRDLPSETIEQVARALADAHDALSRTAAPLST